jgi:hypothetical protein
VEIEVRQTLLTKVEKAVSVVAVVVTPTFSFAEEEVVVTQVAKEVTIASPE